jgi:hypothetical protein
MQPKYPEHIVRKPTYRINGKLSYYQPNGRAEMGRAEERSTDQFDSAGDRNS